MSIEDGNILSYTNADGKSNGQISVYQNIMEIRVGYVRRSIKKSKAKIIEHLRGVIKQYEVKNEWFLN